MDDDDGEGIVQIVARAVDGDQEAWNDIVDRFTPLLLSVIGRTGVSAAVMEDVAQTVWLRLIEHMSGIREPRAIAMWIITTAKREAIRCSIAERRVSPRDPQDWDWSAYPTSDEDPDEALLQSQRHEALLGGIATLSTRQRELLLLLAEDPPLSYAEVSRRSGVPVGAIGPTRARALDRLRREPSMVALATTESEHAAPGRRSR